MPVISFRYDELIEALGKDFPLTYLIEKIPMLGSDIEDYDENKIDIELFPNRPDLYSLEGLVLALKGFFEIETGLPVFNTKMSNIEVEVDPSVNEVRPYIVCGIVKGLNLTDREIERLIEFQEDLHWAIGRDRSKASIGIHDLDKVKPPFKYHAINPEEISFVPLDMEEEMNLEEILRYHPKGIEYRHIVMSHSRYPIITDINHDVLSFPPIINGELTRVTEETKNIFIDITGTDFRAIENALKILITSFHEKGEIYSLKIIYPEKEIITPDLSPTEMTLSKDFVKDLLGKEFEMDEIKHALEKMRYGCTIEKDMVKVKIPCYRVDILHPVDIVEDVAIGYGYEKFSEKLPETMTFGEKHPVEEISEDVRELMISLGFQEVMTLSLTNEADHYEKMNLKKCESVEIENPVTEEHTIVRTSLLPNLMEQLKLNKRFDLPQRIFEIGDVVLLGETETGGVNVRKVCGVTIHPKSNFSEIKSVVITLLDNLGVDYRIEPRVHGSFINGRCAKIISNEREIGVFGEIHPKVIVNYGLAHPVVGFEISIEDLREII
ncbi:MAG: phenylalanine--tRNA ligase subunit beta [Candidatus Hydrothermarchaeota archaeon]